MKQHPAILAIDAGNTSIKAALFRNSSIVSTSTVCDAEELRAWLRASTAPSGAAACSVRPSVNESLAAAVRDFGITLQFLGSDLPANVPLEVDEPDKVGADRLANAIAAYHRARGPAIVVDFGTAIAFDVISPTGAFIGGAIAPGLQTSLAALHEKTALLPLVEVAQPAGAVGRNTVDAMLVGVVHGAAGLVDRIVDNIREQLKFDFTVFFSGGHSRIVAPICRTHAQMAPTLTLEGVHLAWARHNRPDAQ